MIRLEKVLYSYEGQSQPVIDNLDLEFKPGEVVAVIGRNGSGKSTLARLLNGLLIPSQGSVTVDGMDTKEEQTLWQVRSKVGLILQNPDNQLVAPTVEEDIAFGPENLGVAPPEIRRRVRKNLTLVGMENYAQWPPNRLSGGQKQRVAIAGILAMEPQYLVLDEATSMLDPKGRQDLLEVVLTLKARGVGVIIITHYMNEAVLADRVVVLNRGRVALQGSPTDVFGAPEKLQSYGLEAPPIGRIAASLRQRGLDIPEGVLQVEEMVKALCKLS